MSKNFDACRHCQASASEFLYRMGQPFYWLGRWLSPDDFHAAQAWSESVNCQDLIDSQFGTWPIGKWVRSSVHSHFRANDLDFSNHEVESTYRRYLASGYLACVGLDSVLDSVNPDLLLVFNGRMSPTRIALELAKARGVRTICEERGFSPGIMRLTENQSCVSAEPILELWKLWQDTPLNESELSDIIEILDAHLGGSGLEYSQFAVPSSGQQSVWTNLGFDAQNPLFALYTSSSDETADIDDAVGACFEDQAAWIEETIEHFSKHPEWQLAIRVHPNTGGKRAVGDNKQELAFYANLDVSQADNIRIIGPEDDISSFDIMVAADVGLIWHSSMGIDMAAIGRPVIRAGSYRFRDASFMVSPESPQEYLESLAYCLSEDTADSAIQRAVHAWRFGHVIYFKHGFQFPLVRQPSGSHGEPAYKSLSALAPGQDESLDRICSIIMDGTPLHPTPDPRPPQFEIAERQTVMRYVERLTRL